MSKKGPRKGRTGPLHHLSLAAALRENTRPPGAVGGRGRGLTTEVPRASHPNARPIQRNPKLQAQVLALELTRAGSSVGEKRSPKARVEGRRLPAGLRLASLAGSTQPVGPRERVRPRTTAQYPNPPGHWLLLPGDPFIRAPLGPPYSCPTVRQSVRQGHPASLPPPRQPSAGHWGAQEQPSSVCGDG